MQFPAQHKSWEEGQKTAAPFDQQNPKQAYRRRMVKRKIVKQIQKYLRKEHEGCQHAECNSGARIKTPSAQAGCSGSGKIVKKRKEQSGYGNRIA